MKRLLLAVIALTVATAFTAPAFAGIRDAKNKADCEGGRRVGREGQQMRGQETVTVNDCQLGNPNLVLTGRKM